MITAGIDMGIENVKAVILKDGKIIARRMALSGGANRAQSAEKVWNEALAAAGIKASDVSKVVATGQGKLDVKFATDHCVEPVADARAAKFLYPSATSVVDVGADQVRVVTLGDGQKIKEVVINLKCAAGIGIFLRSMGRTLGLTIEEMGQVPSSKTKEAAVSDLCVVFAELDAVAMIHKNTPKPAIVKAVQESVATKLNAILNDKVVPESNKSVLIGGVSRNAGVVQALQKRSGINFLIPENADYAGALGAALVTTE
jgi:predicted CoA-substrate-specific enzyme activase